MATKRVLAPVTNHGNADTHPAQRGNRPAIRCACSVGSLRNMREPDDIAISTDENIAALEFLRAPTGSWPSADHRVEAQIVPDDHVEHTYVH